MKKDFLYVFGFLLILGLITGSLLANIYYGDVSEQGVYFYGFVDKIKSIRINEHELFTYILKERIKVLVLMILISFTGIGMILKNVFIIVTGGFWGYMCSSMVMLHGFFGTVMFLVICFAAQIIFMTAVLIGMNTGRCVRNGKNGVWKMLYWGVLALALVMVSSFLEMVINVNFAKYYYIILLYNVKYVCFSSIIRI